MDRNDKIGEILKNIMEEDSKGIAMDTSMMEKITSRVKPSPLERLREILNHEVEIPVAPVVIGFAALIAITILPNDVFKNNSVRVIDIGGSQIIIRDDRGVADN